ncbi:S-layer homology domain-containing protein [Sporosarcina sp. E16_3]|uniref:S-layer homology domain-containing protein n=1 Tax=Sporosarcina sp. E16_3 TaxID=2789293 RepID=UPI001A90F5F7|nr:S-layer homology domain-containing protein [Sporosarcina sp. E16_3]
MKKYIPSLLLTATLLISSQPTAQAASFTDVPPAHWAHKAIDNISTRGLINGYPDGTYRLNEPVTRAQAAKVVALAINAKPTAAFKPSFQDISPSHGAYNHIRALTECGIFTDGDKFHPNEPLTRAQMAKILALGYNIIVDDNDLITFQDVIKLNQNYGYITTLAELGITTTSPGGMYKPNDIVTRAHMAAFIDRATNFDLEREKGVIYYDKARNMYMDKSKPDPLPPVVDDQDNALKTIDFVNKQRKQLGAKELIQDTNLSKIAKAKAEDMAKNNYFDHKSPTYGTVDEMLKKFNYKWTAYGENIARGYIAPESVVKEWMLSPTHRANIENNTFTHIGSGYATDAEGKPYWVNLFSQK